MTKEDRKFIKELIKGLDQKFDRIDQRFEKLEEKIEENKVAILENKNGIIHNGVMIEKMQDLIYSVAEDNVGLDRRLKVFENHLDID